MIIGCSPPRFKTAVFHPAKTEEIAQAADLAAQIAATASDDLFPVTLMNLRNLDHAAALMLSAWLAVDHFRGRLTMAETAAAERLARRLAGYAQ